MRNVDCAEVTFVWAGSRVKPVALSTNRNGAACAAGKSAAHNKTMIARRMVNTYEAILGVFSPNSSHTNPKMEVTRAKMLCCCTLFSGIMACNCTYGTQCVWTAALRLRGGQKALPFLTSRRVMGIYLSLHLGSIRHKAREWPPAFWRRRGGLFLDGDSPGDARGGPVDQ